MWRLKHLQVHNCTNKQKLHSLPTLRYACIKSERCSNLWATTLIIKDVNGKMILVFYCTFMLKREIEFEVKLLSEVYSVPVNIKSGRNLYFSRY